jgi:hypothetical protein
MKKKLILQIFLRYLYYMKLYNNITSLLGISSKYEKLDVIGRQKFRAINYC